MIIQSQLDLEAVPEPIEEEHDKGPGWLEEEEPTEVSRAWCEACGRFLTTTELARGHDCPKVVEA